MEDTLRAIMFARDFGTIKTLMWLQLVSFSIAFVVSISYGKIALYVSLIEDTVLSERVSILHKITHKMTFLFYFIVTVFLFLPSNFMTFKHLYGVILLSSLVTGIFAFIFELFGNVIPVKFNRNGIVSMLLLLSILIFILGSITRI